MTKQRYKRVYNLAFAVAAVCSFVFVFNASKAFIETNVIEAKKGGLVNMNERHREFLYNQLVKSGKQKEADEFRRDRQANTFGILMTDDETGQPFAVKAGALNRNILFYEENLSMITAITTLVAFIVAYFAFWQIALLLVRYVNGNSTETNPQSK